jgi:hypothetical protein
MLKITTVSQPITVNQIVLCLYSLPGIGKSTLSFTADKPILLDFDKGSYRAGNRKDVVQVGSWADVASIGKDDLLDYNTVVVDTAGRALDFLSSQIIDDNPKNARGSGDLTLQGYGVLKGKFITWMKLLRTLGKDVVLVTHMDEKMEGDVVQERLDVQGGSKSEIYKSSDAIGKLYIDGKVRKLDFSPRQGSLGKNPAQFDVLLVPDYRKEPEFLAHVIRDIKQAINKLSEAQKSESDEVDRARMLIQACTSAADFNAALRWVKGSSQVVKMLMMSEATAKGMKFDGEAKQFYKPENGATAPQHEATSPKPTETPKPSPEPSQHKEPLFPEQGENLDADPLTPTEAPQGELAEMRMSSPIGKGQEISIHTARREAHIPDPEYYRILGRHGAEHAKELTKADFPLALKAIKEFGQEYSLVSESPHQGSDARERWQSARRDRRN